MIKSLLITLLLLIFTACSNNEPTKKLDGKKLLKQKCASCHDLNMPPVISDDELAPPMMAVSFHVHNFVEPTNESERASKAIEFVADYVHNPSFEKSFCDKDSLKRYGLMPSQKDSVTEGEVKAIASYMFEHFNQANLTKIQKAKAEYDALSPGKRIALKYKCLGCHKPNKKTVGPALTDIASKFINEKNKMKQSIKNGTKEQWDNSNGAIMPAFKGLSDKELEILSEWLLKASS